MNSCPLVEDTTVIEECDDGMHCSDLQTNCTEDSDCVNIGDELCLPRDGT